MVYGILSNPVYIGKVRHYDHVYEGEQDAIITKKVWDGVHATLEANTRADGKRNVRMTPLRGLFRCGYCGGIFKETFSKRGQKYYRYLVCDRDSKRTRSKCPLKYAPCEAMERIVLEHALALLSRPELIQGIMEQIRTLSPESRLSSSELGNACGDLLQIWEYLYPVEQFKLIRSIVSAVKVYKDLLEIEYNLNGIEQIVREQAMHAPDDTEADTATPAAAGGLVPAGMKLEKLANGNFLERLPIVIKYDGHKTLIIEAQDAVKPLQPNSMTPMQKALIPGIRYCRMMEKDLEPSLTALAQKAGMDRSFIYHSMELVNLAPDIQQAIISGIVPDKFSLSILRKGIPDDWDEQRRLFEFQKVN